MNATAKTVFAAVLVALGLTLTAWAAEPPKPEPQKGTAATGVAAVSRSVPVEGEPVDMSRWAYVFRQGAKDNPWETLWLDPMDKMLWGALWEQAIEVASVEVEFPAGVAVSADDLRVMVVKESSCWFWFFRGKGPFDWMGKSDPSTFLKPRAVPASTPAGKNVLTFDGIGFSSMKLAVFNIGDKRLPVPQVRISVPASKTQAADLRRWTKPQVMEIEWGFEDKAAPAAVEGRLTAFWGEIERIEPLEEANGLVVLRDHQWSEDLGQRKENRRRGLRLTFHGTTGPAPIISLWTSAGNCGFNPADATRGPMLIPRVGLYITKPGSLPVDKFRESLAAKKLRTVREEVLAAPEESYASAMARVFGENAKKLPEFPKPPYESQMQIDVPEKALVDQWRLGAWHLKRWCREEADGTWQISIWRFRFPAERNGYWDRPGERKDNQTTFEKGLATCIGQESHEIIRAFDVLGGYDNVARGGLNHWLDSKVQFKARCGHGSGFTDFDGVLLTTNPGAGGRDYDLWHSTGHGLIMEAVAHHYWMTDDKDWFLRQVPRLKQACEWTLRQRKAWAPDMPKDAWGYGLQSPINFGDYGGLAMFYMSNSRYYGGLVGVARIMAELKVEGAEDLLRRAEEYRQDIRAAVEKSVARTPVRVAGDGTYRRCVPAAPYLRSGDRNDTVFGFVCLADRDGSVFAPDEPLVREMVDADRYSVNISGQVGYEAYPRIHLLNDDIPMFLHLLYREYAALIRPWELEPDVPKNRTKPATPVGPVVYEFFEHPSYWAVDKTFEEAVFLQRVRNLLVMELRDALWLARATPRAWLEQGKKIAIKNAPTYYGTVAYEIVSDVDNGKINATVEMPTRKAPKEVVLRFRHPKATPIKGVIVNGKPWPSYDKDKETITLKGLTGQVAVTAQY